MRDLIRHALFLDSYCATAYHIAAARRGNPEGNDACAYLTFVSGNEGLQRLLVMGMMADGGDEIFRFLRAWDTEEVDPSATCRLLGNMAQKLDYLFVQGYCRELGFTALVLEDLRRVRTFVVNGHAVSVGCAGGVSEAIFQRALAIMCAWLTLMLEVLKAEFPSFELLHAFCVFDINGPKRSLATLPDGRVYMLRMAQTFSVDPERLLQQYIELLPHVKEMVRELADADPQSPVHVAWNKAIKASGSQHPELRAVLCRYNTCIGCTTSGVEQVAHSNQDWLFTKR